MQAGVRTATPFGTAGVRAAGVAVATVGMAVAVVAALRGLPTDPADAPLAAAIGILALAAFLRPIEPARGEKLSLAAALTFLGALILPGALAVAAAGSAALAAKVAQRRSLLSTAVNAAQVAGATGLASLAAAAIPGGGAGTVLACGTAYAAATLGSVAVMIAASQGVAAAGGFFRRETLPTLALISLGGIASVAWSRDPLVLLFFIPPLAAVELAARHGAAETRAQAATDQAALAVPRLRGFLHSAHADLEIAMGTHVDEWDRRRLILGAAAKIAAVMERLRP